jgi:ornithine cyclodeaminase
MLLLNAAEVKQALPMAECIGAMKRAYAALSAGLAAVPLRARLPLAAQEGVSLFMPAFVDDPAGQALAVKVVSVFNRNPAQGLPLIHAAVLVLNPETGRVEALLEGASLTAIRTGAASGAAIDLLSHPEAATVALFGAGIQGRTQLEAACTVRRIQTAWIYDPNPEKVEALIADLAGTGPIPAELRRATSAQEAVRDADIICCATTASQPVFDDADLKPGVHISGVGSYTPKMQEIPAETVARARVVVDSRAAVLAEAGDIIIPLKTGQMPETDIVELGAILNDTAAGRTGESQITVFKSVGVAVQDAAAAQLALANARKMALGIEVDW